MARSDMPITLSLLAFACTLGRSDTAPRRFDQPPLIEFRLVHDEPAGGLQRADYNGDVLYVDPVPVISDTDFRAVHPSVRQGQLILALELTAEGERQLRQATTQNTGKRMALLLESRVRSAPIIQSPARSPIQAAVDVPLDEADRIAQRIRARWP